MTFELSNCTYEKMDDQSDTTDIILPFAVDYGHDPRNETLTSNKKGNPAVIIVSLISITISMIFLIRSLNKPTSPY
jgi:hypothetical protein